MTPAEILAKAADVIDERGWWQGGYVPDDDADRNSCPVCVLAAINVAANHDPDEGFSSGIRLAAAIALADHLGLGPALEDFEEDGVENVVGNDRNDRPERTAEQVTMALRACAASLTGGAS